MRSRKIAKVQPGFRFIAEKFWVPQLDGRGILSAANVWGTIDPFIRDGVVGEVKANRPTGQLWPDIRDAILQLGGADWLRR
jgi:hypothetical protein